jgi:hypothetical protein
MTLDMWMKSKEREFYPRRSPQEAGKDGGKLREKAKGLRACGFVL